MWVRKLVTSHRAAMAVILAFVLALSSTLVASANLSLLLLSTDPYTDPLGQHKTEVEPDTLSAGSTIVSAIQVARVFDGGALNIGFATSTNGGTSWTNGFLPGTTGSSTPQGIYQRVSDASVAFDARHNVWIISYLGVFPNGNRARVDVLVSRSTDGGLTWSTPVAVNADGHFNDKNWTVCDNTASSPFYGNCYTEFDDNTLGDLVQMTTSTDGGQTWGAAQTTTNKAFGIGGQPLVQPNGTVIVPIVGFTRFNFLIQSFTSTNGGATWGPTIKVATVAFRHPAGGIRAGIPLPSAEIDSSGRVYVVWSDCHFETGCTASDLVLSTSTNGIVWSKVTRIPLDPVGSGVDHFIPGLAVDRSTSGSSAHLAVTYYFYPVANCTSATCRLNVGSSTSSDGGATWTASTQVAGPMSLSWLPNTTQGVMVGDYISVSFANNKAFPAIAVANAPTGTTFDEATYTVAGGLGVGATILAANDQVDTGKNDPATSSSLTSQ